MAIEWQTIGEHKIALCDCRDALPEIADKSVHLVLTDPPYGHNNNNGDLIHRREAALGYLPSGNDPPPKSRPIANDGPEANDLVRWSFSEFARLLRPGCCCCCCCCGGGPDPQFARWSLWLDEHLDFKQMVVWDKGKIGMGWHYRRSYETVLVAQQPGGNCHWFDDTGRVENVIRPGDYGIKKIIPSKSDHPTPKPVALAAHFVKLHSQEGDTVLDPFMGAGWVAEAAVRMGRKFIGIEIDRRWFDKACARIESALKRDALFAGGAA